MARKKLTTENESPALEDLINQYSENKSELDSYKTICEKESSAIKQLMMQEDDLQVDDHKWEKVVGNVKASVVVAKKQTFNEEALLEVIKQCEIPGAVKTKEYVDMDVLESAIYGGELSNDVLSQIDKCREVKETIMLKLLRFDKK